jgi:hypothetical protein
MPSGTTQPSQGTHPTNATVVEHNTAENNVATHQKRAEQPHWAVTPFLHQCNAFVDFYFPSKL